MIERAGVTQIDCAAERAGFLIIGTEDDTRDACLHDSAYTHRAGLQGHVQRHGTQPVIFDLPARLA